MRYLVLLILAGSVVQPVLVQAQDSGRDIRVTYIAGGNVYVSGGRNQGIFPGDTLTVLTDTRKVERIEVLSSMSDRSVLKHLGDGFPIKVGELLRVVSGDASALSEEIETDYVRLEATPEDDLDEESFDTDEARLLASRSELDVTGRLQIGINSLRSETESVLSPGTRSSRTYLTPHAMLSLDASGLPYGLDLRVRMRSEYRYYSGGRAPEPKMSLRTYDLYLTREFQQTTVQFGRFSNRYVAAGGYWDGIQIGSGDRDFGFGGSFGFLPVRSNEQVSLDMPKAAIFANYTQRSEVLSNRMEAFYLEIHPTNDLLTRRLLGLRHRLNWKAIGSSNRLEVDRDPQSGRWVVTRLSGRLSSSLTSNIEVHGRYDLRQPYTIYRSFDVISYRRDQINAGMGYRGRTGSVAADYVWNYAYDLGDQRKLDGRSVTGSASLSRISGVGLTTSGSYWWSDFGASMYGTVGLSRSFRRIATRLYYQVSGSSRFDTNLTTHSVGAQAAFSIGSRIRSTSRIRLQTGKFVTSTAFETSASIRL